MEEMIGFFVFIPILILIYTIFRFFEGKKILKEKEHLTGKIPFRLLFNYPLFSLKTVIATLSVGLLNFFLFITLRYVDINISDSWQLKLLIPIVFIMLGAGILIFMRDIRVKIVKEEPIQERTPESWNILTWIVNREDFLKVINGERRLNYPVSLWIENFHNSPFIGDLIFYSEKSEGGITGRWMILKITYITKNEDMVTVCIEPCKLVTDGTIEIQDELKKHEAFTTDSETTEGDEK